VIFLSSYGEPSCPSQVGTKLSWVCGNKLAQSSRQTCYWTRTIYKVNWLTRQSKAKHHLLLQNRANPVGWELSHNQKKPAVLLWNIFKVIFFFLALGRPLLPAKLAPNYPEFAEKNWLTHSGRQLLKVNFNTNCLH
jgi:hypothetical protein